MLRDLMRIGISALTLLALIFSDRSLSQSLPFEGWGDICDYSPAIDPNDAPEAANLILATALLINPSDIALVQGDPTHYQFTHTSLYTIFRSGISAPIASGPFFPGFEKMAPSGRSGFLVAPNIIVTASHTSLVFHPSQFWVVFDVQSLNNDTGQGCLQTNPTLIPAENVFRPLNGDAALISNGAADIDITVDYAAFYLDRNATGRPYLKMRRAGHVSKDDVLALAAHPEELFKKFQYGIHYVGDSPPSSNPSPHEVQQFYKIYTLEGSSGAPLFNLTRGVVETGVAAAISCVGANLLPDGTYDIYDRCVNGDNSSGDVVNYAPISVFADLVPTTELRTSPLDDVLHVVPASVVSTPPPVVYTLTPMEQTSVTVDLQLAPFGEPQLATINQFIPWNTFLVPPNHGAFTISSNVPANLQCGTYDRMVSVVDHTHGFADHVRHRYEVGLTQFNVEPIAPQRINAITAPSIPGNLTYTISNSRPSPVQVTASSDQSWMALSNPLGRPSSSVSISLAASGQPGSTKIINATLLPSAYSLPDGNHSAHVVFSNNSQCAVESSVTRDMVFSKGDITIEGSVQQLIPRPTPASSPVISSIDIAENFCITNSSLVIDTEHSIVNIVGYSLSDWVPTLQIWLDKGDPEPGQDSLLLWDQSALPEYWPPLPPEYPDPISSLNVTNFIFDNVENLPPNGSRLSHYNGHNAFGKWGIRVRDTGNASRQGYVGNWRLNLIGTAGLCPN